MRKPTDLSGAAATLAAALLDAHVKRTLGTQDVTDAGCQKKLLSYYGWALDQLTIEHQNGAVETDC